MALAAEQDNRVRIPDGTAAVCADVALDENRSLEETLGRLSRSEKFATASTGTSQKTYGIGCFRPLRVMEGAFVAEKRLRHPHFGCRNFYFQEE